MKNDTNSYCECEIGIFILKKIYLSAPQRVVAMNVAAVSAAMPRHHSARKARKPTETVSKRAREREMQVKNNCLA